MCVNVFSVYVCVHPNYWGQFGEVCANIPHIQAILFFCSFAFRLLFIPKSRPKTVPKVKHIKRPPTLIYSYHSLSPFHSCSGECSVNDVVLSFWSSGIVFVGHANQMDLEGKGSLFRPYKDMMQSNLTFTICSWHLSFSLVLSTLPLQPGTSHGLYKPAWHLCKNYSRIYLENIFVFKHVACS